MQNVNEMFEYLRLHGKPMLAPARVPPPRGAHDASSVTDPWRVDAYLEHHKDRQRATLRLHANPCEPGGKVPKCGAWDSPSTTLTACTPW